MGRPIIYKPREVQANPNNGQSLRTGNRLLWNCVYCMAGIEGFTCKTINTCSALRIGRKHFERLRSNNGQA